MTTLLNGASGAQGNTDPAADPAGTPEPKAADPAGTPEPKAADPAGTPEPKAADPKAADPAGTPDPKAADPKGAPETYSDFALPKDFTFNEGGQDAFNGLAKELNLDQAGAQKALDFYAEKQNEIGQAHAAAWDKVQDDWVTGLKTDKDFGGTKFNETIERANRALGAHGSEELKTYLKASGFGNNGELIKMLAKIDKATGDGGLIDGEPKGGGEKTAAQIMYPNQA